MGKVKRPTRWSPQKAHKKYGIRNWLKIKHSVTSQADQDTYIRLFCEKSGFVCPEGRKVMVVMESFVSNRFPDFATWASNYKKQQSENQKEAVE